MTVETRRHRAAQAKGDGCAARQHKPRDPQIDMALPERRPSDMLREPICFDSSVVAVCLLALTASALVHALPNPEPRTSSPELTWIAPAACPSTAEFRERIRAYLGQVGPAPTTLSAASAQVAPEPDGFRVDLRVEQQGQRPARYSDWIATSVTIVVVISAIGVGSLTERRDMSKLLCRPLLGRCTRDFNVNHFASPYVDYEASEQRAKPESVELQEVAGPNRMVREKRLPALPLWQRWRTCTMSCCRSRAFSAISCPRERVRSFRKPATKGRGRTDSYRKLLTLATTRVARARIRRPKHETTDKPPSLQVGQPIKSCETRKFQRSCGRGKESQDTFVGHYSTIGATLLAGSTVLPQPSTAANCTRDATPSLRHAEVRWADTEAIDRPSV